MVAKISTSMRFFFLVASTWLWLGIWLTGFTTIHWIIYIPAVFFLFAAATGICPGIIISTALFPEKPNATMHPTSDASLPPSE
jgi:hypothetical protein